MIEISTRYGTKVRVEGARVVIPGFEWLQAYATPLLARAGEKPELDDERWVITDALTGWKISSYSSPTIDEAIEDAAARLRAKKITPELYTKEQERALAQFAKIAGRERAQ